MKNNFKKLISSLLVIAFLVSAFSIFVSADASSSAADAEEIQLIFNRTFSEGWDYTNGLSLSGSATDNKIYIDKEITSENDYNYFLRFEALGEMDSAVKFNFTNAYIPRENGTVVKLSFKADDFTNVGGINNALAVILSGKTTLDENLNFLGIENGHLKAYADKAGSSYVDLGILNDDWIDIAFVFEWDKTDFFYTIYYGDNYSQSATVTFPYNKSGDVGIKEFTLGIPRTGSSAATEARYGSGFCIDDFQVYNNSKTIFTDKVLNDMGSGILVDTYVPKTIEILSNTGKTTSEILEDALCMKLGVDYALFRNQKQPIFTKKSDNSEDVTVYGAPEKIDGHVMVPLQLILDYIGFPSYVHADGMSYDITTGTNKTNLVAGRDSASVNGERVPLTVAPGFVTSEGNKYLVIALDDVETLFPGWLVTYDDMGLIIIYEDLTPDNKDDNTDVVNRNTNLDEMVNLMKKFLFDTVTTDEDGNALKAADAYVATGAAVYEDVKANTNNFKHPYIGATQESFDKLNRVYNANAASEEYNAVAKSYLATLVAKASDFYNEVALLDANGAYAGIKSEKVPVNVYKDGNDPTEANPDVVKDTADGYDSVGGRLTEIVGFANKMLDLAFAYQVTRDTKYAELAYDWAVALGQWEHWGPGYMSDCAEATYAYAMAYDWLYNIFFELEGQTGVEAIARIIFEKGVHDGYVASNGRECEHPRNLGDESRYSTLDTSTNAVGTAGMVVGALAIMEFDTLPGSDSVATEREYLVGNNIINLINNGLDVYAPDGSFIESPTYWAFGTNYLFRLIMSLTTAAGTDYGFVDTWGIDTTCYYAIHIESSDGKIWNYHEGGPDGVNTGVISGQDTQMFNFAAALFGDSVLAAIRDKQLNSATHPKTVTIYDMLYFPFDGVKEAEELPLDYRMDGIDGFVVRSGWEDGSLYTGIMGGANDANYGQYDSGNFIYHNEGVVWFMDLGSDNHSAYQYLTNSRNRYYRANAEGQNVVLLTSDTKNAPNGQYGAGDGQIVKTLTNEHGSLAIIDNASVYQSSVVTANRGIFVTNDRKTVVIQDEINFGTKVQSFAWVAHTAETIEIDSTGRTAYLTSTDENGVRHILRATLVSDNKKVAFSTENADYLLLEGTFKSDGSTSMGGAPEFSRAGIKKLMIQVSEGVNFKAAVVLEMVDSKGSDMPVGYEWMDMGAWVPYADGTVGSADNAQIRDGVQESDIRLETSKALALFDKGTAFTENLEDFYSSLTTVEYTAVYLEFDIDDQYFTYYQTYLDLLDAYEAFMDEAIVVIENTSSFARIFSGMVEAEPEVDNNEEG